MRIISGTHKGRQLFPDKNFTARPTTDFAKENLFNILVNHMDIEGCTVVDLFAGTGSISYEFASRGAAEIITVEKNKNHFAFIQRTVKELGFKNIRLFRTDVFIAVEKLRGRQFDIVFADPPYDLPAIAEIPAAIFNNNLVKEEGIAIVEHPATTDFSDLPFFQEKRVYGSVNFSIFRKI